MHQETRWVRALGERPSDVERKRETGIQADPAACHCRLGRYHLAAACRSNLRTVSVLHLLVGSRGDSE